VVELGERGQPKLPSLVGGIVAMSQAYLKDLALLMTVNCVRNTVIEDYHAEGKLDDSEMEAFNREVADKIYTFLQFLLEKPDLDRAAFLSVMSMMYPSDWDKPKADRGFVDAVKLFKKVGKPLDQILGGGS
jgi:hypothetical protein